MLEGEKGEVDQQGKVKLERVSRGSQCGAF